MFCLGHRGSVSPLAFYGLLGSTSSLVSGGGAAAFLCTAALSAAALAAQAAAAAAPPPSQAQPSPCLPSPSALALLHSRMLLRHVEPCAPLRALGDRAGHVPPTEVPDGVVGIRAPAERVSSRTASTGGRYYYYYRDAACVGCRGHATKAPGAPPVWPVGCMLVSPTLVASRGT